MIPKQIADWAKRFVCGNESEMVQKHIKLLADSDKKGALLIEAIQQVLEGLKPAGFGGRKFGHSNITEDQLPFVNENGFFLRATSRWEYIPADYENVVQFVLNTERFQTVVIDHVDNLFYSGGQPYLFPNRPVLKFCEGVCQEKTFWHAQSSQTNAWTVPTGSKSYLDYWDVAGVEGTIREDFILNESDVQNLVEAFLDERSIPERFTSKLSFIGFHPEIAKEYIDEFGETPPP